MIGIPEGSSAGIPGVFSLADLAALGKGGNLSAEWLKQAPAQGGLISGGGNTVLPQGLPKGYYQLPGQQGAYYYDPASGQVSKEFADWASGLKAEDRDPFTGVPKALMDSRDSGEVLRSGLGQDVATMGKIIAMGRGADGTYQDSQDRVLGDGQYQQFLLDKNNKQIRVSDIPALQAAADARTVKLAKLDASGFDALDAAGINQTPLAGAFDRLGKEMGKTGDELGATLGIDYGGDLSKMTGDFKGNYYKDPATGKQGMWIPATWAVGETNQQHYSTLRDALAANYEKSALGQAGLQDERAARGLDPATGISMAEKKRIYDTYSSITDAGQKAAYLSAQDPGNLIDSLRTERTSFRSGEDAQVMADSKEFNTTEQTHFFQGQYLPGEVNITSGARVTTDSATGRSIFTGNSPISLSYNAPRDTSGSFAARFGGAMTGAALGFTTGGTLGAILGAYSGAGGWMPDSRNISMTNAKGFGTWKAQAAHLPEPREVGSAIAFATIFGTGVAARSSTAKTGAAAAGAKKYSALMGRAT